MRSLADLNILIVGKDCTEREIKAVNSEHKKNLQSDMWVSPGDDTFENPSGVEEGGPDVSEISHLAKPFRPLHIPALLSTRETPLLS